MPTEDIRFDSAGCTLAETGPRGYRRAVRQPVSPAVLGLITEWSARQWARGNDRAAEPG